MHKVFKHTMSVIPAKAGTAVFTKTLVVAAMFSVVLFAGCGSTPRTRVYTIDMPAKQWTRADATGAPSLAIHISSPRYLGQPYIAYRSSPYSLEISRYSKWDSPPDEIVSEALRETLSKSGCFREVAVYNSAPSGHHVLTVRLKKFERSDEAGASYGLFEMDVSLASPDGDELFNDTISYKETLSRKNFQNLARGLSRGLADALESTKAGVLETIGAGE